MNAGANVRTMKTAAEQALADTFAGAQPRLPGKGAVAAMRAEAFRRFEAAGLPHRRVEAWKYTDLRALMREANPLAPPPDADAKTTASRGLSTSLLAGVDCRRIVFVNGCFVPELSDLDKLEPGLRIRSMAQAMAEGDPLIEKYLGKVVDIDDAALALNTALMGDGALVHIGEGAVVERPILLIRCVVSASPVAVFPRSLIVAERKARATVISGSHVETKGEGGSVAHQSNAATELVIGDGAEIDYLRLTTGAAEGHSVTTMLASLGANARFDTFNFTNGGAVVRNQMFVRLDGEGTKAGLRGVNLLRGRQHADTTLVVDHAKGHCESRELFKTALYGESRGVFQGKIVVRPHAQKTDGKMTSNALLLSEDAEMDNKPELEIFADDVVCGHGATAGAIDEDLKFYLLSRGIPPKEAEALLIQAFVGEALEAIVHEDIRNALMASTVAWLEARS
ncbi:MAG: Fe-S cluster assembly protein SufD [Pseudolabrys sp.]